MKKIIDKEIGSHNNGLNNFIKIVIEDKEIKNNSKKSNLDNLYKLSFVIKNKRPDKNRGIWSPDSQLVLKF